MPPPAVTASSSAHVSGGTTTLTFAHTATGDPLYVAVATSNSIAVSTVTYGGVALTKLQRVTTASHGHEWWFLAAPTAGTANVVVTSAGFTSVLAAGARSVSGVDLGTIYANLTITSGTSTAPSVVVTSAGGALVLDHVNAAGASQTFTAGAGQTATYAQSGEAANITKCAGSWEAGAASVTMSWALSLSITWAISGLSVPAAAPLMTEHVETYLWLPE